MPLASSISRGGMDVGFLLHADSRVWYKCFGRLVVFVTKQRVNKALDV